MINLQTAEQLLDFRGARGLMTAEAAKAQLEGAVALHNILDSKRVAYLADEVGMGKTYVALGTLALFRHFDPGFRVLVIAPRENIQSKWIKELRNFVRNNVRFPDLRVKAVHGAPARQAVACDNLIELVHETGLNPDRDFFVRLTSFSLAMGRDAESRRRRRDALLRQLPWADESKFDLRSPEAFKDNFARAVGAALPAFDLVIVDEGHNLKAGFKSNVAARNRVLALAFGHPSDKARGFPGYAPKARRVLFLSATPLESDYVQLWNQLDVFGLGDVAPELVAKDATEEAKKACAQTFLIRRVTAMKVGDNQLTKNMYRREWRFGGVNAHDVPLEVGAADRDRQRLIVALVQKKVSELLGHERFNNSFQIGMLASFESFLETSGVRRQLDEDEDEAPPIFDNADQAERLDEKLGVDVTAVNGLARSYRQTFGAEMPHPKMDAVVEELASGLPVGRKALVFVRRVASVKELQAKLNERYDRWLLDRLRTEMPEMAGSLDRAFSIYKEEQLKQRRRREALAATPLSESVELEEGSDEGTVRRRESADTGGLDSFFAWFFRGEGPDQFSGTDRKEPLTSGAALQRRFTQASGLFSTFFEDNYVAQLLKVRPDGSGTVLAALADYLNRPIDDVRSSLLSAASQLLPSGKEKIGRLHQFLALQAAALDLLMDDDGPLRAEAIMLRQLMDGGRGAGARKGARLPARAENHLEDATFFTELRAREGIRDRLWQAPRQSSDRIEELRQREVRRLAFSAAARLGHPFIDLYVLAASQIGSRKRGDDDDDDTGVSALIAGYLDRLEAQMRAADAQSTPEFTAFRELSLLSDNLELLIDVNAPDLRTMKLSEVSHLLGTLFGRQQPIGGMYGGITRTLVRQFRLPGYPLVLVTTDLLQEGEDLHTFCSAIYHYGISWMPSSMEQRIGRIDRVNSHTERRLTRIRDAVAGEQKLQVYYPHLRDTVEVLQVNRVLRRMDQFIRLMHDDLRQPDEGANLIRLATDIHASLEPPPPVSDPLKTAFPIRRELLDAPSRELAVSPGATAGLMQRFRRVPSLSLGDLDIQWADAHPEDVLVGTVRHGGRMQPFSLVLRSFDGRLMLRCISPIGSDTGKGNGDFDIDRLGTLGMKLPVQVSFEWDDRLKLRRFSAESAVLLGAPEHDASRVAWTIERVTSNADLLELKVLGSSTDRALDDETRKALEGESELGE